MAYQHSIPLVRELGTSESDLLRHILFAVAPERLREIYTLKVIGRCGCGACPTVIFGTTFEQVLSSEPPMEIARYTGFNSEKVEVGLSLLTRGGLLSEMEVWGLDDLRVRSLPTSASLMPIHVNA